MPATGQVDTMGTGPVTVTCHGLTKQFGGSPGVLAVDGLDLDVPAGSVVGLLGPNGAGKTTTLRMVTGLARPTSGTVAIDGATVDPDQPDRHTTIGVLDQAPRFYGWMRGRELIRFAAELSGLEGTVAGRRTDHVLDQVGLADAAGRRIAGYSGGMRQRLGLAAALVAEPRLLVLDEPVSSLDPEGRRDLLGLIAGLRHDTTVLFSTHVLDDVERICDRVAILDAGRLVADAPLPELLARYAPSTFRITPAAEQEPAIGVLIETIRRAPWCEDVIRDGDGAILVGAHDEVAAGPALLSLVVAANVRLDRFERARPTLEDVFLRLVGRRPESSSPERVDGWPGAAT